MEKKPHRGTENLTPLKERTSEELAKMRRNGGIASGKVRRVKANARAAMKMYLNLPLTSTEKTFLESIGGDVSIVLNKRELATFAVGQKVIATGDASSYMKILEIAGEHVEALDMNTSGVSEGRPIINIIQGGVVNQLTIHPKRINGSPLATDRED